MLRRGTVIEQRGASRTGDAAEIRPRHGIIARALLPALLGAALGTPVDDFRGAVLDVVKIHGTEMRGGMKHGNRHTFATLLRDRP